MATMKVLYDSDYDAYAKRLAEDMRRVGIKSERDIEDMGALVRDDMLRDWEDLKDNLNIPLDNPVLCIARLGLWNGPRVGYKILGRNVADIFTVLCGDYPKYWVDAYNIRAEDTHHDGTNYYLFRELRVPEQNCGPLLDTLYNGRPASSALISRYTKSLLPYVRKRLGF